MKALRLHRWNVTPAEARRIQEELRHRVELADRVGQVRTVAGADVAFDLTRPPRSHRGPRAFAGVVVYRFPEMTEIERASAEHPLRFPYVPGLLSFREAPALLAAFELLRHCPDVIFCDGQGYAHPRRFGIACHLGVLLDCATIGCAKSRLIGTHTLPAARAGAWKPLRDPHTPGGPPRRGEIVGAILRTRPGVRPIFVSIGHRVSLARALELTLAVCDGYRIPRPTREADQWVERLKREARGGD